MKKLIAVLGILLFTTGLTACNTFRGMGQDVERGGEKVQDAATTTQRKCNSHFRQRACLRADEKLHVCEMLPVLFPAGCGVHFKRKLTQNLRNLLSAI